MCVRRECQLHSDNHTDCCVFTDISECTAQCCDDTSCWFNTPDCREAPALHLRPTSCVCRLHPFVPHQTPSKFTPAHDAVAGLLLGRLPAPPPCTQPRLHPTLRAANRRRPMRQGCSPRLARRRQAWTRKTRPASNFEEIRKFVNVLYKWQWRPNDGTYEDFDEEQCIEIEINWRKLLSLVRVWGSGSRWERTRYSSASTTWTRWLIALPSATRRQLCGAGTGTRPRATAGTTRMMMCALSTCRLPRGTTRWWPAPFLIDNSPMAGRCSFRATRTRCSRCGESRALLEHFEVARKHMERKRGRVTV